MSTEVGNADVNYTYNEHGSMASMQHLQTMTWDFAERLSHITRETTEAYYNYDNSGQRMRKVVEKNNGSIIETRLYFGWFEIWRKKVNGSIDTERETLHIMDDVKRIAVVETKTVDNGTSNANPTSVQRYQLSNNIESATLELDENANIISYEEYYPYGETSYRAGRNIAEVGLKRYKYTGKEKDEESGLYYYGARYYACWLGRWIATDPAGLVDGLNLYMYCRGSPVILLDGDGKQASDVDEKHSLKDIDYGSKKDALKDFKPNTRNKGSITIDGEPCGVKGEDYGFLEENGGITGGITCMEASIETKPKELKSKRIENKEGVYEKKYDLTIEVSIKLKANKIYYLKEGELFPGTNYSITKANSEEIYLHEKGHQLDNWRIVPPKGNTFTIELSKQFSGKNETEVEKQAQSWKEEKLDSLSKEYAEKTREDLKEATKQYHNNYGNRGNPWNGYSK
jgi:RHS repeat-associated protein